MTIRQRAVHDKDKRERRDAILDAAQRLLERDPEGVVSVADVADAAGLAKGTVYLYFPSKGALLLAVHERALGIFFDDVARLADRAVPPTVDAMLDLTRRHIVRPPLFLPLATRCLALMRREVSEGVAAAFGERMTARLASIGAALERQFPTLIPGDGAALMRRSYALIVGLWQMTGAAAARSPGTAFPEELEPALRTLWRGTLQPVPVAAPPGTPR